MNIVAYPLQEAERKLKAINSKYEITIARPKKVMSESYTEQFYVIRQQVDNEGIYHLTIAAKMGKGVF